MVFPTALLDSLKGIEGFDQESFEKVHLSREAVTSIRLNPAKSPPLSGAEWPGEQDPREEISMQEVPWCASGYYLFRRPSFTFDPLFHAGCYYVQEASSMFLEQALKQTCDLSRSLKVLDLCAAPGGKSTHLQSLLSPDSLLVSNEVIRSRVAVLKDNLVKWGAGNALVTNNDPAIFSHLENYFDVIVVDAPCSGSGLFRRDEDAIAEWSPAMVALCNQRQQRILSDIWPSLKRNGILIYSTCSFSREEDEDILDYIHSMGDAEDCRLQIDPSWNIVESSSVGGMQGYRFFPDKIKGEGFFLGCVRKTAGSVHEMSKGKHQPQLLSRAERLIVQEWVQPGDFEFIRHDQQVYAWPAKLVPDFTFLLNKLSVIYSGTIVGDLFGNKLVPAHSLAMRSWIGAPIPRNPLKRDEAIRYLQRKEIDLPAASRGWQLVTYDNFPLGWVNVLANRINNYYPKELRILKES